VVVLTDGFADASQALWAAQRLRAGNFDVQVIRIGGGTGDALQRLASIGGGRLWNLNELPQLIGHLQASGADSLGEARADSETRIDVWRNDGFWLVPPLLLLAVLLARRGWV
jgi:hypothetical protein